MEVKAIARATCLSDILGLDVESASRGSDKEEVGLIVQPCSGYRVVVQDSGVEERLGVTVLALREASSAACPSISRGSWCHPSLHLSDGRMVLSGLLMTRATQGASVLPGSATTSREALL